MYNSKYDILPTLSVNEIKKLLNQEQIKTVSFDLFDTLLMRPCKNQRSVFYLLQNQVKKQFHLDFVELRYHAEEAIGKENATLDDIWNSIATRNGLSAEAAAQLKLLEIQLETDLLIPRPEMKEVFDYAVSLGKRVIVTSDMYLSSEILGEILRKKALPASAKSTFPANTESGKAAANYLNRCWKQSRSRSRLR